MNVFSQNLFLKSDTLNNSRLKSIVYTSTIGSSVVLGGLSYSWYSDYSTSKFHFFNDNKEWLGMDKLGHACTAYQGTSYMTDLLLWSGVSNKKSALYGGLYGFSFLLITETLDGFSSGWGASPGDLIANSSGVLLYGAQQLIFKEQPIQLKFSFHYTKYAQYRPELMGAYLWDRWLKDYNGQTYWLSINPSYFLPQNTRYPKWLSISFGYGADGMLGGAYNPLLDRNDNPLPQFTRLSEFYLSLDIDWRKLHSKYSLLNFAFKSLSFIKIPAPTLILNNQQLDYRFLYW